MSTKDFSYKQWVDATAEFVSSHAKAKIPGFKAKSKIAAPLTAAAAAKKLPKETPACIAEFITTASAAFTFRYNWDLADVPREKVEAANVSESRIYGGAKICVAASLGEWLDDCKEWATDTWIADEPAQLEIWQHSFPFATMENGDYLAVRTDGGANPPAVYLAHDDESKVIAPSFTEFLKTWERLCYLGPEIWLLEDFIDPDSGFLDPKSKEAEALRELFEVKVSNGYSDSQK